MPTPIRRRSGSVGPDLVEAVERLQHVAAAKRVPAAGPAGRRDAEQRHDAVAEELVDRAPVALDRLRHDLE